MNPADQPSPAGEKNLLIEASAGSGKTHDLVGRILRLLMTFRQPDQIIALTFTRKAAGEFFDRILGALARAAESEEAARKTAEEYRVEGLDRNSALALLRLAIDSLHRLSLGTLDSFYSRVLRTFPAEFGINGNFEVIQEAKETTVQREVFDVVLSDLEKAEEFLGAFRQATFGADEKQLLAHLERFVGRFHRLLLACPDRDAWSRPTAIWPEAPWWLAANFDLDDIVKRLRQGMPSAEAQHKSAAKGIEKFAQELPLFSNGATGRDFSTL
ncbi:MAG: UvrD-helicase domain-containing protein, partial [Verrucomicrobiae bacterium]|nr:UvrD-helicase domain-containing protein [Verrucomicrobiae bacterium]